MNNTFYNFKLDLEPNIIDMIYDILRMSTIQLVTQTMFYMNNSSLSLFSESFVKTFVFINFGIIVYYLLIRRLFSFVSDDYLRVTDNNYTPTPPMNNRTSSNLSKAPAISTKTPVNIRPTIPVVPAPVASALPKNVSNTPLNNNNSVNNSNNSVNNSNSNSINNNNVN
jgi:hypothetical protein